MAELGVVVASDDRSSSAEDVQWSRSLLDRLPSLIGYWDRRLCNVFANSAYIDYWGTTPEQVAGRHIRDVLGEEIYELNLPYIRAALAGQEQSFSRILTDSQGATRHAQVSYIPNSVDGRVDGFYAVVTDVTARVEAEIARAEALRTFHTMVVSAPFGKAMLDTDGVL
ncbi:MAG: PAS domain-containing protein, partial [Dietzia sp.]|nr:PAS domain-containing protein [Dietzia sp.]